MKSLFDGLLKLCLLIFLFISGSAILAQTGKISGNVKDANTGEPLIGANVIIEGRNWGAATDVEGDYSIINIPPGKYTLRFRMLGYSDYVIQDVVVSINRTVNMNAELKAESLQLGQEVVVTADKVSMKKDQTGSIRNVSRDQIEALPVENLTDVVNMQAGVVKGHFRGGRSNEVTYMVDGLVVDDSFSKESRNVGVENEVVQEVEVITGTFNAEYGNAMSGVVNAITRDGGNKFSGSVSIGSSNYLTSNKDVFIGLEDDDFTRNTDFKASFSGPIIPNTLSFVVNGRYQDRENHLNGIRRFNVEDYSRYTGDRETWYSEHTGDGSYTSLSSDESHSLFGKLSLNPTTGLRIGLTYNRNYRKNQDYNHDYKYNPDGRAFNYNETDMFALHVNHSLSDKLFYEFKASVVDNERGYYLIEDPVSSEWVHELYSMRSGRFLTGGQEKAYTKNKTLDVSAKFDLTWMVHKNHIIKTGVSFVQHNIDRISGQIRNDFEGTGLEAFSYIDSTTSQIVFPNFKPVLRPDSSLYSDIYEVKPIEAAWYIQDKMEYDNMVINFGLRLDYFDPNTVYPTDWRNPANDIYFSDENSAKLSTYPDADSHLQLSPRLGLSYQLGDAALLRFAYGHFFQMPPLFALYNNHSFLVAPNDFTTPIMGNPNLKPQKTVQYEIGLWQQLQEGMGLEVAVFYRDIYDLLSTRIITTYNQVRYGLYTNLDYGNVKGLELKFDYLIDDFTFLLNYTLQYTRGNADRPERSYDRAGDELDPVNKLFRMPWDQRHTLNASVSYSKEDYGVTLTAYYNSGEPYTWGPLEESRLSLVNLDLYNSAKPGQFSCDLRAYYYLIKSDLFDVKLNLAVYNLFDTLLEEFVYHRTGRAYKDIIRDYEFNTYKSDFTDVLDDRQNPAMYSAPREVKLSLDISF